MANKTIGELTAGITPDGTELTHAVQAGNSRKFTVDQLRGFPEGGTALLAQGDMLYVNGDGEIERLPKGSAGQVLRQNSGLTAPEWSIPPFSNFLRAQEQKPSGTNGFNSTAGATVTRTITDLVANNISGASLSSNRITLPEGDYLVSVEAAFRFDLVGRNRIYLYNFTDSAFVIDGVANSNTNARLSGAFLVAGGAKEFEIRAFTESAATAGHGLPVSDGRTEIYLDATFWKL